MHYLITGGAGFIGSNIVKKLLADGHKVRVLDNYSGGNPFDPAQGKEERFQEGAEYMEGDIRKMEDIKRAVEGIDGVFHLAAVPRVPYSVEHPIETNDNNINGTLNLLVGARDAGVKRLVFSSSSSVYGGNDSEKLREDMCGQPISPYALHKYTGEMYGRLFSELYGFETVSLRYFNVYGPMLDPEGAYALVVGKFFWQRSKGEPMTICGDGEYYRDYTYVSDVVEANVLAMTSDKVGKGEVINAGYGEAKSVNELAKLIGGETVNIPDRPGDPRRSEADNTRARELLGWSPTIKLEDGIKLMKKEWGLD
ncbi:MAG: NAD-dependent epimerase/dehydratase family protein [bacterium]|nr:NAD-dependent epimerase/dehydratase family protein [bacterium]